MNNKEQINVKEYVEKLEQLQQGIITMNDWLSYCESLRNSIAAEKYLSPNNKQHK